MKSKSGKISKQDMDRLGKLALKMVEVDFEFHLAEEDVKDAERVFDDIRVITIPNTMVEFGLETDLDDKQIVDIEFGYAKLSLPRKALIRAYNDWRKRDKLREKRWKNSSSKK